MGHYNKHNNNNINNNFNHNNNNYYYNYYYYDYYYYYYYYYNYYNHYNHSFIMHKRESLPIRGVFGNDNVKCQSLNMIYLVLFYHYIHIYEPCNIKDCARK